MSLFTSCEWIETTALSIAIREGALYYPILGAFHLAAIAWFGGMVLMSDLRILGIGLRHESISDVLSQFRRWKWLGFLIILVSGALLWWAEPIVCYKSLSFRIKLVLLLLVGLNALVFRSGIGSGPVATGRARLAAWVSMLLWFALILAGRGIAFL